MDREYIMQIQMMEQEVNQLNEQLSLIEQNANEIKEIQSSLNEIGETKEKELLVNIGKKIFLPVEIKNKKLILEVGNKVFVEKSIKDTLDLIESQLKKLDLGKDQINARLEELQAEMEILVNKINKEQKNNCNCKEDDECKHDKRKCKCEKC